MASAQQDLVVRMKTNSTEFNQGIDKAKGKLNEFKNSGTGAMNGFSTAIGAASKAFAALGLAIGAKNIFTSFINSTESMHDKWNNEIGGMKDGWKDFLWQVNTSNFSGFDDLISKARKAREELDALGDANALFDLANFDISADLEEVLNRIQKKKKKGLDITEDVEEYNRLLDELRQKAEPKTQRSIGALESLFGRYGFNLGDMGLGNKDNVSGYLELAEMARAAAAGVYDERIREYREARDKTATGDLHEEGDFVWSEEHDYLAELREKRGWGYVQMSKMLSDLADIPTADKDMIDKVLKEYFNTKRYLTQQERKLNRYLQAETPSSGGKSKQELTPRIQELIPQLKPIGTENTQIQFYPNAAKPLDPYVEANMLAQAALEQLEKEEEEMARKEAWQKKINEVNVYGAAIGHLSNAFSNLAGVMNDTSPMKKFMNVMASVVGGIQNMIQVYTSLVAVESVQTAIESGKGIPFPYNLVAIAAAAATLTGIIATIVANTKSQNFAYGGIVQGSGWAAKHDGIQANVSAGEMVLNEHQQMSLWRMIVGGGANQYANVEFIIRGEDLVGTIDNYNKNSNY